MLAKEIDSHSHLLHIRAHVAENYFKLAALDVARKVAEDTLDMLEQGQDIGLKIDLFNLLGRVALQCKDFGLARERYERSFFLAQLINEPTRFLCCLVFVAEYLYKVGRLEESRKIIVFLRQTHSTLPRDEFKTMSALMNTLSKTFLGPTEAANNEEAARTKVVAVVYQGLQPFKVG